MAASWLPAYRDGIGFYALGSQFSYLAYCLADGLSQLGIPVYSNISAQDAAICDFGFRSSDTSTLETARVVIIDLEDLNEQTASHVPAFNRQVLLAMNDNLSSITPQTDIPFFCTHENCHYKLPGIRIPWGFGLSTRMMERLVPEGAERSHRFIANFRPTYAQPVRQALDLCLVDRLRRQVEVDSALTDDARWGESFYQKLRTSIGCLAYGGFFAQDLHKAPFIAERLPPSPAIYNRDTVVLRWDSWRFWESLAAGCATVQLDFDKYGFMLPVMPINGVHYLGIDLENIPETVSLLTGATHVLRNIGDQGRQWAITHYSPVAVAKRFLSTLYHPERSAVSCQK
jgi:hypothetical protein